MSYQSEWLNQISNINSIENNIDYFFTQRKVNEIEEILDEKTLDRKKNKVCHIYNFLAINLPTNSFKSYLNLVIDIEIWGDNNYNFKGTFIKNDGEIPHIMIKLKEDKNIFVKLTFKDNDKLNKTYISFIPVTKRFQHVNDNQTE
jgi:hypothetical protein|uniref:Uncharacterized protein n=1 Tax=viral metagenome TaxID=1070528 RepID=A0A6C0HV98_9ZZZZ